MCKRVINRMHDEVSLTAKYSRALANSSVIFALFLCVLVCVSKASGHRPKLSSVPASPSARNDRLQPGRATSSVPCSTSVSVAMRWFNFKVNFKPRRSLRRIETPDARRMPFFHKKSIYFLRPKSKISITPTRRRSRKRAEWFRKQDTSSPVW